MSKKGGSYSAEFKKGDIAEILRLLQLSNANRNTTLQKELVKRVCAYMSLGIDVSSLFSEMIMVSPSTFPPPTIFSFSFPLYIKVINRRQTRGIWCKRSWCICTSPSM